MNKIQIGDKKYNCSNRVFWHIQGLKAENSMLQQEIHAHENYSSKLEKELQELQREFIDFGYENKTVVDNRNELADRIDKAIEVINALSSYGYYYGNTFYYSSAEFKARAKILLEILEGDSNG